MRVLSVLASFLAFAAISAQALAQRNSVPTAFTYQGVLNDAGQPYSGLAQAEFRLYTAQTGGDLVATTSLIENISVVDGLFRAEVDFGISGLRQQADWLEIAIAPQGDPGLTTLAPRQHLASAPFAVQASGVIETGSNTVIRSGSAIAASNTDSFGAASTSVLSAWQSFRPNVDGVLESVSFTISSFILTEIPGVVVTLYEGQGTSGLAIESVETSIQIFGNPIFVSFPSSTVLDNVNTYTIEFTLPGPDQVSVSHSTDNPYSGGRSSFGTGDDLVFSVRMGSSQYPLVYVDSRDNLRVDSAISVLSDDLPAAPITVEAIDLNVFELDDDDIVAGGFEGVLGLYGTSNFSPPAAITLSKIDGLTSDLIGKWGIYHDSQSQLSGLKFSYGTNRHYDSNPTLLSLETDGAVGIGTESPLAKLHVVEANTFVDPTALDLDRQIIAGTDAVLGLYSPNIGSWGSAVVLKALNGDGTLIDTWSILRRAGPEGDLRFNFGPSASYGGNPTQINFDAGRGTLGVNTTNNTSGMLVVQQDSDTTDSGVAIFDATGSQSIRLWVDPSDVRHIDANNAGAATLELNRGGGPVIIDNLVTPSTAAIKDDIETIVGAVDTLLALRGVRYTRRLDGEADIGFIAEEMAEVLPEIVAFDHAGLPVGIEYQKVTALLVEALKQQQARLEEQGARLDRVEDLLETLAAGD